MNKLDIKKTFKPAIDILIINPIVKFNTTDLYLGSEIGLIDKNLKTGIHFGFFPRTFRKRILIKSDEKKFYQYYEKRSNIELSIDKYLHLLNLTSGASVDFYAFGKFVYSIGGNYPGSEKKAESVARIVPGFGIKWGDELFKLNVGYEYFNLGIKNINSHWINVGISLNINMHKKKLEDRIIEWY